MIKRRKGSSKTNWLGLVDTDNNGLDMGDIISGVVTLAVMTLALVFMSGTEYFVMSLDYTAGAIFVILVGIAATIARVIVKKIKMGNQGIISTALVILITAILLVVFTTYVTTFGTVDATAGITLVAIVAIVHLVLDYVKPIVGLKA